jgi:hypothetical protein
VIRFKGVPIVPLVARDPRFTGVGAIVEKMIAKLSV